MAELQFSINGVTTRVDRPTVTTNPNGSVTVSGLEGTLPPATYFPEGIPQVPKPVEPRTRRPVASRQPHAVA
jgi:hypothetical protein